jgi:succinate dehydrogenase hydrophobic anchor subunit
MCESVAGSASKRKLTFIFQAVTAIVMLFTTLRACAGDME